MSDTTNPASAQADGPLTEEEVTAFSQALASFQESLPPRQREAFAAILTAAGATDDDVQGYFSFISQAFQQARQIQANRDQLVYLENVNKTTKNQNNYTLQ